MPDSLVLTPPGGPRGDGSAGPPSRELVLTSAALALVTTIYMQGGYLVREKVPVGQALTETLLTLCSQFFISWAMLWTIRRLLGTGAAVAERGAGRIASTVLACAVVGTLTSGLAFVLRNVGELPHDNTVHFVGLWNLSLSALLVAAHVFFERSRAAAAALHDARLHQLAQERELSTAHLQLLQAQVEPHFIFNALANVRRLLRTDSAAARTLLTDLLRYLEQALPHLRNECGTLGQEAELVRAYLAVHQVRMGSRLRAEIDIPDELAACDVPPMVLLTLVENALKHGLQPMVDGGTIRVQARREAGQLTLTVADTGHGMGSGSGHGTGLANLRARLKSMHGARAHLALAVNEPRGVVATVSLPERSP